jgi:hypothetical protein
LRRADPTVQGVLQIVYRIKKLKNQSRSNKGIQSHREIDTNEDLCNYFFRYIIVDIIVILLLSKIHKNA